MTTTQKTETQIPEVKSAKVDPQVVRELLTKHELTIRKFAHITGASYLKILKASKAPESGKVYDAKATNWNAIAEVLSEVENIGTVLKDTKWEDHKTAKSAVVEKDVAQFEVGKKVYLRRSDKGWEIVWRTETHVVIMEEGTTEPRSWGWETFLANGPSFSPRKK